MGFSHPNVSGPPPRRTSQPATRSKAVEDRRIRINPCAPSASRSRFHATPSSHSAHSGAAAIAIRLSTLQLCA